MELWGVNWELAANISQVVATLGLIVTLIFTGVDIRRSASDADRSYQAAEASAERAEAASRVTIDQFTRIADSLEAIAARGPVAGILPDVRPARVQWSLTHYKGDTYQLENEGDATAHSVVLEGHETLMGPDHVRGGPDLQPGEALTFMAVRTMGTSDSTITVSWVDGGGEAHSWRYPLPPRPPR